MAYFRALYQWKSLTNILFSLRLAFSHILFSMRWQKHIINHVNHMHTFRFKAGFLSICWLNFWKMAICSTVTVDFLWLCFSAEYLFWFSFWPKNWNILKFTSVSPLSLQGPKTKRITKRKQAYFWANLPATAKSRSIFFTYAYPKAKYHVWNFLWKVFF